MNFTRVLIALMVASIIGVCVALSPEADARFAQGPQIPSCAWEGTPEAEFPLGYGFGVPDVDCPEPQTNYYIDAACYDAAVTRFWQDVADKSNELSDEWEDAIATANQVRLDAKTEYLNCILTEMQSVCEDVYCAAIDIAHNLLLEVEDQLETEWEDWKVAHSETWADEVKRDCCRLIPQ